MHHLLSIPIENISALTSITKNITMKIIIQLPHKCEELFEYSILYMGVSYYLFLCYYYITS